VLNIEYEMCKCKCTNKNVYAILCGPENNVNVKNMYLYDFKGSNNHVNIKQYKKCDFYLRRGDFINLFMISQLNGPLQKETYQNIHSQLIHMTLQEGMVIKGI